MVAEAVAEDLRRRGHEAFLFFCDAQFDTPDKHGYYSQPDRYYIWRFPVQGEGTRYRLFPS